MWKDVHGYEEFFQISSDGRLFSKRSNRELTTRVSNKGYAIYSTKIGGRNGRNVSFRIHREVAKCFIENPNNLPEVNHKDGDKSNNNACNLEWVDASTNIQHAYDTGLISRGKGRHNHNAVLTDEMISYIRKNAKQNGGLLTQRELAEIYKVDHTTIGKCLREPEY